MIKGFSIKLNVSFKSFNSIFKQLKQELMTTDCVIQEEIKSPLVFTSKNIKPEDGEVSVKLNAASVNKRDVWISKGMYAKIQLPCIPGSDGCGEYEGSEVIILPSLQWGSSNEFQSKEFMVLGMPKDGTFANHIFIDPKLIYNKPKNLDYISAASLPLSGLTAWRALFTKAKPVKGDKILISGVGGGVATFVLQFAVKYGLEVYVTSGQDDKIAKAQSLGASGGANYKTADFEKSLLEMSGGFDIVIDSAGGPDFHKLLKVCNPGARVVMYGGTLGNMDKINPQLLFWKQISIIGSTMGTADEFKEMIRFIEQYDVQPVIDSVYPLEQANEAYQRMESGDHFGKIVLEMKHI